VCNILSNSTWPSLSRANILTFRVWSAASFFHFLHIYFVVYLPFLFFFFEIQTELGTINYRIRREEKRMPFLCAISLKISIHNCWSNNRVFIGTSKTSFYFSLFRFFIFSKNIKKNNDNNIILSPPFDMSILLPWRDRVRFFF
jgi:hypothetical protein